MSIALCGCAVDPGMALIPTPERKATILPSEAPERTPDGFANILADPATVAGLPRTQRSVATEEARLRGEASRTAAAARGIRTTSSVAALQARGRDHVAETRAAIEKSGRPQNGEPARTVSGAELMPKTSAAANASPPPSAENPGVPIDPDAPAPRAVGVPPFTGNTGVAPAQ